MLRIPVSCKCVGFGRSVASLCARVNHCKHRSMASADHVPSRALAPLSSAPSQPRALAMPADRPDARHGSSKPLQHDAAEPAMGSAPAPIPTSASHARSSSPARTMFRTDLPPRAPSPGRTVSPSAAPQRAANRRAHVKARLIGDSVCAAGLASRQYIAQCASASLQRLGMEHR